MMINNHANPMRKMLARAAGLLLITAAFPLSGNEGPDRFHPKLEQRLFELMEAARTGGSQAGFGLADEWGLSLPEGGVRVVISLTAEPPRIRREAALSEFGRSLAVFHGFVETSCGRRVQAVIPPEELAALASLADVEGVRLPFSAVPLEISEGVASTGASAWHGMSAYRNGGDGVRIGILDAGFDGFAALLGSELPATVTTRCFRADGDFTVSPHGTGCAEIVHDMAPQAELFLANFSTDVEHYNAVDWLIEQGVDVISYSMGWLSAGAGDGTGPICADVERAAAAGIVWVSAAGNSAQRHWQGKFHDVDEDDWCDFKNTGGERDLFAFYVEKGDTYQVWLNWDDWGTWNGTDYVGAEGQDYDLYLYDKDFKQISRSVNRQTQGFYPVEVVSAEAKARGWRYIRIKKRNASRDCRLELFFSNGDQLEHVVPYGSLLVPADSADALAVGAVDWRDDAYHGYSSRGPTSDSRIKPDLCAPSGVSSVTYGETAFYGTSSATPHVAGAVALLLEKTPFSSGRILDILFGRSVDLGTSGKDNAFGTGRLKLNR